MDRAKMIPSLLRTKGIFYGINLLLAIILCTPPIGVRADGFWWGSAITPGFDRSTVIQAEGIANKITLNIERGMSSFILESQGDAYIVMIAPGWYLKEQQADIQNGDHLNVEGSKMTDPKGKLYIVASRITNKRTGTLIELRDDQGNPRWMGVRSPRRLKH